MKKYSKRFLLSLFVFLIGLVLPAQEINWEDARAVTYNSSTNELASTQYNEAHSYALSESVLPYNKLGYIEVTDFYSNGSSVSAATAIDPFTLYFTFEEHFNLGAVDQNSYSLSYDFVDTNGVISYHVQVKGPQGQIALIQNINLTNNDVFRIEKTQANKILLKYNTHEYLVTDNFIEDGHLALYVKASSFSFTVNHNGMENSLGPEINVNDFNKNWVMAKGYDNSGAIRSASVGFFDCLGKPTQSQSRDFLTDRTWASEVRYDGLGRSALQTYSSPLSGTSINFKYHEEFITQSDGTSLTTEELDIDSEDPYQLRSDQLGDVGWYYSDNNTLESYQDIAEGRPFVRTIYDELNPGNVRAVAGGKELDVNGNGQDDGLLDRNPQGFSYTVPAAQELYYVFGKNYFGGPDNSLGKEVILKSFKSVVIDAHGNEMVSFNDSEGKLLASARSGGTTDFDIVAVIKEQGYIDVHIPKGINNSDIQWLGNASEYAVWNLRTGQAMTTGAVTGGNVYRIIHTTAPVGTTYITAAGVINTSTNAKGIRYPVNYYDFSLNYYDDSGRLRLTSQPNGFDTDAFDLSTPAPNHDMHTSYVYNATGEVKATASPDEGSSEFVYREDGQIRFSRNTKQGLLGEFSYTNYDALGRPVESGAYEGFSTTFTELSNVNPQCVTNSRVSSTAGTVTKNGVNTWHSAGFYSNEQTGDENFRLSFQVTKDLRGAIGVTETPFTGSVKDQTKVEYSMYFRWNQVNVRYFGNLLTLSSTTYEPEDTFFIERIGNALTFKKNKEILHVVYLEEPLIDYVVDGSIFFC